MEAIMKTETAKITTLKVVKKPDAKKPNKCKGCGKFIRRESYQCWECDDTLY